MFQIRSVFLMRYFMTSVSLLNGVEPYGYCSMVNLKETSGLKGELSCHFNKWTEEKHKHRSGSSMF